MHKFTNTHSFFDNLLLAIISAHPLSKLDEETNMQRLNAAKKALFGKGGGTGSGANDDNVNINKMISRVHKDQIYHGKFGDLFPAAKKRAIEKKVIGTKPIESNKSALARHALSIKDKHQDSNVDRLRLKIGSLIDLEDSRFDYGDEADIQQLREVELLLQLGQLQKILEQLEKHGVSSALVLSEV